MWIKFSKNLFKGLMVPVLFCCAFAVWLPAQTNPAIQQKAIQELQRRGVDEAAVRAKLLQRGIDIDHVKPEQLPNLQPVIEEVIKEVEAEKAAKAIPQMAPDSIATANSKSPAPPEPGKAQTALADTIQGTTASVDDSLPALVYGQQLFRGKSLALYHSTNDIKAPDTYVLSTGDALTISIFGASQFDNKFEINREGFIQPSRMPKIFLKGLRLAQAKELLRSRFAQFYVFQPEQFAVSLSTARAITVNIFGEAKNYGSFTISAVNTAFNALVAAGGPTDLGSVRNISLIRGRSTKRMDVYEFMNNPAVQYDFFLEDNDIIHIPVAERVVGIRGAVNRPFRYELIKGEDLFKLIEYAGGLGANAYREIVQVRRFENDKQILIDVRLKDLLAQKQDFALLNGDEVIIRNIPSPIENTATIEGAVELPGKYALTETRRISDLLQKGLLKREARTDLAFLLRVNPNQTTRLIQLNLDQILAAPGSASDLQLQAKDLLTVYKQSRFTDRSTISVTGAVRDTLLRYPYTSDSSITLQRALLLAGGLLPDANGIGYILRSNPNNSKEKQYIKVDLFAVLGDANSVQNIVLQPFDQVEALSRLTFSDAATIRVSGAVRQPGEFEYGQFMTLREALIFAGGFKLEAALNRLDVYRVEMKENQPTRTVVNTIEVDSNFFANGSPAERFLLQPFDEIVVRAVPEFEFQRYVKLAGEVKYPGRYALVSNNERLTDIIERAGGLSGESFPEGATLLRTTGNKGYVVTNLVEAMRVHDSPHNHILKEGDEITIPKREDLVSIRIANTKADELYVDRFLPFGLINAAHNPGKRAGWYIRQYAAGFDKGAKRTKVSVLNPNGKINRTSHFLFFKVYPKVKKGSVVSVGAKAPKTPKDKKEKKTVDWDKRLTQVLATAGTLATVVLAITAFK